MDRLETVATRRSHGATDRCRARRPLAAAAGRSVGRTSGAGCRQAAHRPAGAVDDTVAIGSGGSPRAVSIGRGPSDGTTLRPTTGEERHRASAAALDRRTWLAAATARRSASARRRAAGRRLDVHRGRRRGRQRDQMRGVGRASAQGRRRGARRNPEAEAGLQGGEHDRVHGGNRGAHGRHDRRRCRVLRHAIRQRQDGDDVPLHRARRRQLARDDEGEVTCEAREVGLARCWRCAAPGAPTEPYRKRCLPVRVRPLHRRRRRS